MTTPTTNQDEFLKHLLDQSEETHFIGNFHKTLPHNDYGEVDISAYKIFKDVCIAVEAGQPVDFESIPNGDPNANSKFTSPLAGASSETHGPEPQSLEIPPAPGILSESTAAEMVELYWMALLRDEPLANFSDATLNTAVNEVRASYEKALTNDKMPGAISLVTDLPTANGALDIRAETLFRCGLKDEEYGPLVSQFFLRNIPYGVQTIDQRQTPYVREKDFLISHEDWLHAQNTGKDQYGRDYGSCNNYAEQIAGHATYYPSPDVKRYISTMRDLARFVNRDALHQAYFNAALFLNAIDAPVDDGNPYKNRYKRQGGFATLGGPDLLTLVSEVASRALKVVWRQKWLVHRRARPEVYGGLLQMEVNGYQGVKRPYGLPELVRKSTAANMVNGKNNSYFLPMAFSAGSPAHPAYGAGHATVAGACVTVLKAWFDEDAKLGELLRNAMKAENSKEPGTLKGLVQPGAHKSGEDFEEPSTYTGDDADKISVGGELNKIASNVAMGRSMGGVHWRSDNTRSLRLGEEIAIEILRKRTLEYAESLVSFAFTDFDRRTVVIRRGKVAKS